MTRTLIASLILLSLAACGGGDTASKSTTKLDAVEVQPGSVSDSMIILDDATEMREVGCDVQRKSVKRHPALHAHPDRSDLRFASLPIVSPDADASVGAARFDAKQRQRVDHPSFERGDISAYVASAPGQVVLDIADALAGTMISVTPAAPGVIDRKARV